MTFNIRQLDNLTYDEAEPLLEDYIDDVIERIFPRKVTLLDASEADDAIPELVAFWKFLKREYKFRSASAIVKYLETLGSKFPDLMSDPSQGGFMKAFLLMGHQAGLDMTTPEGIQAFQEQYNASIKSQGKDAKSPQSSQKKSRSKKEN